MRLFLLPPLCLLSLGLPAALRAAAVSAAPVAAAALEPAVQLKAVDVLGSRIRQTDTAGPSPVSTYGGDFIRGSGAMTLSELLNVLPQTYAGISSGRGSAPNEFNPEFGQRTETANPPFNLAVGSSAAPPAQSGVSGVSLRGLGSGSTLVLVDGRRAAQSGGGNRGTDSRQGFVDLNTIPLGMIERVELITDGASALYGADAVAGVINIVLKKDYAGSELSGSFKGAWHGGARERNATFATGFAAGKLRGTFAADTYDRADLKASERPYSKNQDHRFFQKGVNLVTGAPVSGVDLRLNWGYPAVVQARTGLLAGVTTPGGGATALALVPAGAAQTPSVAQFVPVGPTGFNAATGAPTFAASGVRRGNTAEFIDLVPPAERYGANLGLTYEVSAQLQFYLRAGHSDSRGRYSSQPPVSTAAAATGLGNFATIVPAAYNPFGQDVIVGLVHYEFGSVFQTTRTKADNILVGARGTFGQSWRWDTGLSRQEQRFRQVTRDFNGAGITAALANPDPALRLNPFVDFRAAGNRNAAVYESLARYNTLRTTSDLTMWDFTADGDVLELPGGTLRAATGFTAERAANSNTAVNQSEAVVPVTTTVRAAGARTSHAVFAEFSVPVFGKKNRRPGLRRLEFQLAGRYEDRDEAGHAAVPKIGFSWVPAQPLLVRGSYGEGFRAPGLTEYQVTGTPFSTAYVDPRRTPAATPNVLTTRGANPGIKPETSTNEYAGLVFEPPFAKGLNLSVNWYRTRQRDVIQVIAAQNLINNEAAFPGRVVRAAPEPVADVPLGQPGRILSVDTTLVNFGEIRNDSIDYAAEYRIPGEKFGRFTVNLTATNTLKALRDIRPGQPALDDAGDTFAPPKWKLNGSVFWRRGPWSASAFATYLDAFGSNRSGNALTFPVSANLLYFGIPSQIRVDVRGGYEFARGLFRGYGKGLRVNAGIGNVFDRDPPFSNTIFGFNGALHNALGRTYEFSFALPF